MLLSFNRLDTKRHYPVYRSFMEKKQKIMIKYIVYLVLTVEPLHYHLVLCNPSMIDGILVLQAEGDGNKFADNK